MKKIYSLLSIATLSVTLFAGRASAQITLTAADMPQPGEKFVNGYDTLGSSVLTLSPGAHGAGVTWNFGSLPLSYTDTNAILTVASTAYAASFPSATVADSIYGTPGENYLIDSTNFFSIAGAVQSVQGNMTTAVFKPAFLQLNFPATYSNISGGTSMAHVAPFVLHFPPFDSAKAIIIVQYADTIDSWGNLTTPQYGGSKYKTIRQKHYELDIDSVFLHNSTGWQYFGPASSTSKLFQYRWYANGIGDLVGLMTMDTTNTKVTSFEWYQGYPDGINEVSQQHNTVVYPSPCTSQITFHYNQQKAVNIFIYDVTGRQLARAEMKNNVTVLNTSAYSAGMYFYNITDNSGHVLDNGKFTVAQ